VSSSSKLKPRVETVGKFLTAKTASSAMLLPSFAVKIRACSLMPLACAALGAASYHVAGLPPPRVRNSRQAYKKSSPIRNPYNKK
jgi:hypothetical protein